MNRCMFICLAAGLLLLAPACSTKKDTAAQPPEQDVYMGDTSATAPPDQIEQDILADDMSTGAPDLPPEATTPAAPAFTPAPRTPATSYVSPLPPVSVGYPDYSGTSSSRAGRVSPGGTYVVKRGDSLWSISRRHGTTVNALAAANNISPTAPIREGQRLTIPGGAASVSSAVTATTPASGGERTYRVQPGDSYYKIARKFGVSTQKLMEYNGAKSPTLRVGQTIRIP